MADHRKRKPSTDKIAVCMASYAADFDHVKLAIKYTQMNGNHQYYREKLLQNHTSKDKPWRLGYIAEPLVIQNRYILKRSYTYTAEPKSFCFDFDSLSIVPILFCPHSLLGTMGMTKYPFRAAVRQAFHNHQENPREDDVSPTLFSCIQCPTDFSVLVREDEAVIVCWSDLGTGESPQNPYWQSHLWGPSNNLYVDGHFEYKHGSIRKMYTNSVNRLRKD